MTLQDAIQFFGSKAKLAHALGVALPTVYEWEDDIPEGRQYQIELATCGALKADKPALRREAA